ncbi:sporulation membrane protein YtrI [Halobacillus yeomjeoni]|uniref:sporulation membrane protein YtrI n=1 Tax=Halobacillus yeomjeoni TaxID=311194 RepID=UPI001A7E37E2|nr:sporulation membrane protein YtrI [Halobacillus yeomjeoni]
MIYIPQDFRKKEWKRFFAGLLLGTIAGYMFFLFIHGQLQEKYAEDHIALTSELNQLEAKYQGLLNQKNQEKGVKSIRVLEISLAFDNAKKLEVDLLTQHQLSSLVKDQLKSVTGKDLRIVADQVDLMITAIESKNYVVDDFTYQLKVKKLIVSEIIHFNLEIKIVR